MAENKYWDEEVVVAEIPKDTYAKYIVSKCKKGTKEVVNVREWYNTKLDPTWRPSKSGMAVPIADGTCWNLIQAMTEANAKQ